MSSETFEERVRAVQALMEQKQVAQRAAPIDTRESIILPKLTWVDLKEIPQRRGVPDGGPDTGAD